MDAVMGARVYVANYAGHDYTPLNKYGRQIFITKGYVSFQGLDRVKYLVGQGICTSSAEDWLALSGTNIINVIAAILWFQKHGICKILNFDKDARVYRELVITKENNDQLFEVLGSEP